MISDGFLKLESLDIFDTPTPNEIVRRKSGAKRSDKKRQRTCRQLLLPLIKKCRLLSLETVASCRLCSVISSHFNFHLLSTQIFTGGLSCQAMTVTAQRKGGGKPFRSILEPHFEFIRELRQRRKTWRQITELLLIEKGIRVTVFAPYLYYRRKLKRAAKPHWENAGNNPESQPVRPNVAASQSQSRPSPLAKPAPFKRPNIKNINTDQEFT